METTIRKIQRFIQKEMISATDIKKHINKIDEEKFSAISKSYKHSDPFPGCSKYLDLNFYLKQNLYFVHKLNLDKQSSKKILDIGTGTGYFPFLCNNYGHEAYAIDLDEVPMYNELIQLFNISRKVWRVNAYERLPDFGFKFDLVTAFMICFNTRNGRYWEMEEWDFFLKDIAQNHLNDNGEVFLFFNYKEGEWNSGSENLLRFFKEKGGKINLGEVYFKSLNPFR